MSQSIIVTYLAPGNLTWATSDSSDGTFASGTASTVGSAGAAAIAQVKSFLANKATTIAALSTGIS